jgi:hypothetical protein
MRLGSVLILPGTGSTRCSVPPVFKLEEGNATVRQLSAGWLASDCPTSRSACKPATTVWLDRMLGYTGREPKDLAALDWGVGQSE